MMIKIKILDEKMRENLPAYATPGSAGLDLRACFPGKAPGKVLKPNETLFVPTGIAIHIDDPDYAGFIYPRSGLGVNHGVVLANTVGVIDSDYQGQLMVALKNTSNKEFAILPMERIAQLVIMPIKQVSLNVVDEFDESERGEGGFGSTGRN